MLSFFYIDDSKFITFVWAIFQTRSLERVRQYFSKYITITLRGKGDVIFCLHSKNTEVANLALTLYA